MNVVHHVPWLVVCAVAAGGLLTLGACLDARVGSVGTTAPDTTPAPDAGAIADAATVDGGGPDVVVTPAPALCLAQTSADPVGAVHFDIVGVNAERLEIVGTTGFIATSSNGTLHVLDLSEPAAPVLAATLAHAPNAWDLLVDGDQGVVYLGEYGSYAYPSGLGVVAVSDPTAPTIVATHEFGGSAFGIARFSHYLAAVGNVIGLIVFDVATPTAPTPVGRLDVPGAMAVAVDGRRAYVFGGEAIEIVDLTTVTAPARIGAYPNALAQKHIAVGDDVLYVPQRIGGGTVVQVVDVSDAAAPVELGVIALPFHDSAALWLQAKTLYVSTLGALFRFDVSDPAAPVQLGPPAAGCRGRVTVSDDYVQLACGLDGVRMIPLPIQTAWGTVPVGRGGGNFDLAVRGKYVYVAAGSELVVFDVAQPSVPVQLSPSTGVHGFMSRVILHDDFLVVATPPELHIRALAPDPAAPPIVARIDVALSVSGNLAMAGDLLLLTSSTSDLRTADLSDPTAPGPIVFTALPFAAHPEMNPRPLAADADFAYVGDGSGEIAVVSLADRAAPALVAIFTAAPGSLVRDLAVAGGRLYVRLEAGLQIYDLADPTAPTLLGSHASPGSAPAGWFDWNKDRLAVAGDLVFVTGGPPDANFTVLDASDPAHLVQRYVGGFPYGPRAVAVVGDDVYILTGSELTIRRLCEL